VPGAAPDDGNLDEDLTGTWTLSGDKVTFSATAGTLIQGVEFTATENHLSSTGTVGTATVRLVLVKAG
jgi:hypothetical protein